MEIALHQPKSNALAKSVALPVEHGSWGFLFEPLAAGILLAPSTAAPFISLLVVGAFLLRQPLKFLIPDLIHHKRLPRTLIARKFTFIFGAVFALGAVGTFLFAPLYSLIPFAAVAPLAVYQIYCDSTRKSRELLAELNGAFALSSTIAVLALAGGWTIWASLSLWAIMLARLIPSILYVRSRLRLEKGKPAYVFPSLAAHLLALDLAAVLAYFGLTSMAVVWMLAFLFGRAIVGLSSRRQKATAKTIGIREVIFGTLTVLAMVCGYYFGI